MRTDVVASSARDTHERQWVNWEIEQANRQGKRIVGVYVRGGTEADLPPALEKYASTRIVGWNADAIIDAIDDKSNLFQNSDGSVSQNAQPATTTNC